MIRFPIVDCHLHIWDITNLHYSWLDAVPFLKRTFLLPDYNAACGPLKVEKMVFVQCECEPSQYKQEVKWVTEKARSDSRLQGIVSWAPLEKGEKVRGELEELKRNPLVKGIRRIIQFEEDLGFCLRPDFIRGVKLLPEFDFTFDICISHLHTAKTIRFVDHCPEVRFILDHIGKPDIKNHKLEPWRSEIKRLAEFPNVYCKVSSLATEADHDRWTYEDLRPYVEWIFECFGFDRTVFAGDWPVSSLSQILPRCVETTEYFIPQATEDQKRKLFHDNGIAFYGL